MHHRKCPNSNVAEVHLSYDGVQESKSSSASIDIYSVSFPPCRKVYPLKLIRPTNRFKYEENHYAELVINEINESDSVLRAIVLDNPKRSLIRRALSHSASYTCEYCEGKAVSVCKALSAHNLSAIKKKYQLRRKNIENTIMFLRESPGTAASKEKDMKEIDRLNVLLDNLVNDEEKEKSDLGKKKLLAWPASTMNSRLRAQNIIRYIMEKIERNDEPLDKDFLKGFKGKSILIDQPNFHFIHDIPAEYMHSGCLGVGKRLVELTFNVGEVRDRITKRTLSDAKEFDNLIKLVQVVREFTRRFRNLDLSIIKAQEYRNILLVFFPLVIKCIPPAYTKERKIWLYIAYALRACIVSNAEFDNIELQEIKNICQKFYLLFESVYGKKNCTYSIHIVISHLLKIRGNEPLTARSAFLYENFYSEMRNLFQPGTPSPVKQILRNTLVKRSLEKHVCKKEIKYGEMKNQTGLENNSRIYVLKENAAHEFYNIVKVNDDKTYECQKQGHFPATFDDVIELSWGEVGVYKLGPRTNTMTKINNDEIAGKFMIVDNYMITCPINILDEQ